MKNILRRVLFTLVITAWAGHASAVPITAADIVTVDGTDWAQVDLFLNLSWLEINTVCPSGVCTDGGMLNGYDMTDWQWASVDDLNGLYNRYIGTDELGPGPASYLEPDSLWAPAFFADGWRPDPTFLPATQLLQGYSSSSTAGVAYLGFVRNFASGDDAAITSIPSTISEDGSPSLGAWFYRETHVPAPATLALLIVGLAGIRCARYIP